MQESGLHTGEGFESISKFSIGNKYPDKNLLKNRNQFLIY